MEARVFIRSSIKSSAHPKRGFDSYIVYFVICVSGPTEGYNSILYDIYCLMLSEPRNEPLILRSRKSPDEWEEAYFDLRSESCAGQARGSETDSMDDSAFHLFVLVSARKPLACRHLHINGPDEAQVRFMAVDENCARSRLRESHSRGIAAARRHVAALKSLC